MCIRDSPIHNTGGTNASRASPPRGRRTEDVELTPPPPPPREGRATADHLDEPDPYAKSPSALLLHAPEREPPRAREHATVILPAIFGVVFGMSMFGFRLFANASGGTYDVINQNEYDRTGGRYTLGGNAGYTEFEFGGLLIQTYLLGFCAVPLLIWLATTSKLFASPKWRAGFHLVGAVVLIVVGSIFVAYWGQFWQTNNGADIVSNNSGYVVSTGLSLWAFCFSLAGVLIVLAVRCMKPGMLSWARTDRNDMLIIGGFLIIVLPTCLMLSTLLPNWSLVMKPNYFGFPMFRTTNPSETKNVYGLITWNSYDGTCGKWGEFYWCLYYDVLIWYAFLYALCAVALLGKFVPGVQRILSETKFTPPPLRRMIGYWSIGEALLVIWFCGLIGATIGFWSGHKWEQGESTKGVGFAIPPYITEHTCTTDKHGNITSLQQWARIFGQVCNVTLSLLALPTARSSVWSKMLGVSWEAMQKYHAALGYAFMLFTAIHQLCWWGFYKFQQDLPDSSKGICKTLGQLSAWPHDILSVSLNYHNDNFTNPLIIIVWWCMVLCMGVFAFDKIRRSNFELFYYTHHLYIVIYIAALLHAPSLWYFLISGLGLWFTDRLIRFSRGCSIVGGVKLTSLGDGYCVTELEIQTIDGLPPVFEAGQYAFINIPEISTLQWHPFTIASAPSEGVLRFYIKAMGHDLSLIHI
eukprot:TRINITY_DN10790_c0_g1_i2.p1 TRINITY_DN10790_c0_g1~~TRINITY_DN10790_c0_g1_i2.p1  ORF type:complete len:694 (+),score=102.87 TRINITY_DN10790_c0_g1_i2:83-2164(+)